MATNLEVDSGATQAATDADLQAAGRRIEGRSLSQIAWMRLKRDKVALVAFVVVVLVCLIAIFAPLLAKLEGATPYQIYPNTINGNLAGIPKGPLGGISGAHWLGVEPGIGRDIFARIIYGARTSLIVSVISTIIVTGVGGIAGIVAGYLGGWIDSLISRIMDTLLSFPQLLFFIALIPVFQSRLTDIGLPNNNNVRVGTIIFVFAVFGWPYMGRIIRGQTLSLREREFVDAARSIGASTSHIVFKQLLPNLVAPILVYATLIIPTYISNEAALSFLGVGVQIPAASWGEMLSDAVSWYASDPMFLIIPGVSLFILVLAFNLFGDGLRDALDPKAGR